LDIQQPAYPCGRCPRCGRKANEAATPYPNAARSPARTARPTRHLSLRKSRRVAPSGPVAAGEGFAQIRPEGGRPGRPAVLARQDVESRTPVRSPTRPEGQ